MDPINVVIRKCTFPFSELIRQQLLATKQGILRASNPIKHVDLIDNYWWELKSSIDFEG